MQSPDASLPTNLLSHQLRRTLLGLNQYQYPHVPNPPGCEKRASVALILRVRPTFPDRASFEPEKHGPGGGSNLERLESFFNQEWVQRGDPEVLFIKRAAREGDRWTSHIAFPGGRRDLEDHSDCAASIRETMEEVGLDLATEHCLQVGNLSERIVTTWLGKAPYAILSLHVCFSKADRLRLMVLCPFVFLLMRDDIGPLMLQPTEVHSAHWVSLRALLSPYLSTYTSSDVSGLFGPLQGHLSRGLVQLFFGRVLIKAIDLVPTESVYCSSSVNFLPSQPPSIARYSQKSPRWPSAAKAWQSPSQQLTLWGLTLGKKPWHHIACAVG